MTTPRFICTTCGHITTPPDDNDQATGRPCIECLRGWASRTTSPAGRYAAHRLGIELPESAHYCQWPAPRPIVGKRTGNALVDNGGARICPNHADADDRMCTFHRIGGTVKTRRLLMIESLF